MHPPRTLLSLIYASGDYKAGQFLQLNTASKCMAFLHGWRFAMVLSIYWLVTIGKVGKQEEVQGIE